MRAMRTTSPTITTEVGKPKMAIAHSYRENIKLSEQLLPLIGHKYGTKSTKIDTKTTKEVLH